jgi:hypothetical protein
MAKDIPNFRGVFMRDSLPVKIRLNECGIVNLDSAKGNGTHWVAYYKTKLQSIYFDSFGLEAPLEVQRYLGLPYSYQTFQLQRADDVICGHLCILILEQLANGYSFKNIILQLI